MESSSKPVYEIPVIGEPAAPPLGTLPPPSAPPTAPPPPGFTPAPAAPAPAALPAPQVPALAPPSRPVPSTDAVFEALLHDYEQTYTDPVSTPLSVPVYDLSLPVPEATVAAPPLVAPAASVPSLGPVAGPAASVASDEQLLSRRARARAEREPAAGEEPLASPGAPVTTVAPVPSPTVAPQAPAAGFPAPTADPVVLGASRRGGSAVSTEPEPIDPTAFVADGTPEPLRAALAQVVELRGSDLHVSANAAPMIRVDGGLKPIDGAPVWTADEVRAILRSILSEAQQEKFDTELELDFAYTLSEDSRFRVNIYQQRESMGAAFRLIPTEIKTLTQLGVPASVERFSKLPRGLVLVTGPTGSGKSTTLAALIDKANETRADHIMTVEDPIEFMHTNKKSLVNQREVGGDTHSFAAALKHVLRQDPDIILVGEMRDLETISVALTAAETGHLVYATLHTQSSAQTIDRIIDVFPPHQQGQVRAQLAATLQGVVCQTLVKRASGKGRVVATEVMVTTPAVANLIREGKTYQVPSAMQAGRELGMHTMDQNLAELVNAGTITHEAALEKVHNREDFEKLVHRQSPMSAAGYGAAAGVDYGDTYSTGGH